MSIHCEKRPSEQLFDLHGRARMQIFSREDCQKLHTKRPVSAHFLSYEVISMRNVKHMLVTKFSIDKSKRCTTA